MLRRQPSTYLLLGAALLEAALALGAIVGLLTLGGSEEVVHAPAPLAICLLALAVVIVRVDATA